MSAQQLVALAIFSLVSAITPGPNNFFVLNCSVVFGWRRALPAWCGVCVGFFLMLVAVGAGLRELFIAYPVAYTVLKVVSVCYLLYLSWRVATAAPRSRRQPLRRAPDNFFADVCFSGSIQKRGRWA